MQQEEIKSLLEAQGKAFEDFKAANDARLEAMAEGKAVSDLEEKTEKINGELTELGKKLEKSFKELNAELEEIAKKANRPEAPGSDPKAKEHAEHKAAFDGFMRKGKDDGLAELQIKAVQVGVDEDGGYAVPEQLDRNILQMLRDASPMRQVCRILQIGGVEYKKNVNIGGAGAGWVGETDPRPETDSPKMTQITPYMGEVYANPASTQRALDDMFFDAAAWLSEEVAFKFAEMEGSAFLTGDGTNKPKGLLTYPTSADPDSARAYGTLQAIKTGAAAGFVPLDPAAGVGPGDCLIDAIYALKGGYRTNATWMMSGLTLATVRKWKDAEGQYLWQPSLQAGQPSMLLGYPVRDNEDMPLVEANAIPIMFGDFRRGYTIVDRYGIRVLRDPYTNKPYVHFYTTKRVGSMLEDSQAIKLIQCAA